MTYSAIEKLLGAQAESLLGFSNPKISQSQLHLPSMETVNSVFTASDRSKSVLRNLQRLYGSGRLANTGYVSILPVDQGIEHTAMASFSANAEYFDPENIITLALEGGCNAVASTYGVLAMMSRKYAHKIPFIVKINHNELLTYPTTHDQVLFSTVDQAAQMGAAGVGATIYFGSPESSRQIVEISQQFARAHELGLFTVLWCYVRNPGFSTQKANYEVADDLTAQANHLGVTIGADLIKQKQPELSGGFRAIKFAKWDDAMYDRLTSEHPIDQTRLQVAHCYMGRVGLINSGGASGENDLQQAVVTAVINKRAGGAGLISGRKAFQKPLKEGIDILHAIQDVYLEKKVTVA